MFGIPSLLAAIARAASALNHFAEQFEKASEKLDEKMNEDDPVNRLTEFEATNGKKRK